MIQERIATAREWVEADKSRQAKFKDAPLRALEEFDPDLPKSLPEEIRRAVEGEFKQTPCSSAPPSGAYSACSLEILQRVAVWLGQGEGNRATFELDPATAVDAIGGPSGSLANVSRSNLPPGVLLAVVISNACIIRDLIRANLDAQFNLSSTGTFLPDDPFVWTGSSPLPIPGVATVSLTALSVFVSEAQQVILGASFSTSLVNGAVTATAWVRVPVNVTVAPSGSSVVARLTPMSATVTASRVDVAAWVYLVVAVGAGPFLLSALAIADAMADPAIAGPIGGVVNGALAPISFTIPLPPGLAVGTAAATLFQADAPRRMISIGGIATSASGRDHDLVVRLA